MKVDICTSCSVMVELILPQRWLLAVWLGSELLKNLMVDLKGPEAVPAAGTASGPFKSTMKLLKSSEPSHTVSMQSGICDTNHGIVDSFYTVLHALILTSD